MSAASPPPSIPTSVRLLAVSHTGLRSGAENVLLRLLVAARENGWDARCAVPEGPFADQLRADGVPVVELPTLSLPDGRRATAALRLLPRALRAARILRVAGRSADLVVANGLLGLPALRLARLRAPVIWLVHDIVTRPDWRAVVRVVRPAVRLAVAVSDAAAAPLRAQGLSVQVVRNGTAWPVESAPRPTVGAVVGCLGLLTPWKGQSVLLEAVAGLPGVRLELVGGTFPKDADYAASLAARADQPDLRGRVRIPGQVADVHDTLRSWTVVVSPSTSPDPAPLVVLEAMSVGVPVVATDHGGPPEYLQDAGLLVPPSDVAALREALRALLDDPDRRGRLGAAGRERVAGLYRLDDRMAELLDVLASVRRP